MPTVVATHSTRASAMLNGVTNQPPRIATRTNRLTVVELMPFVRSPEAAGVASDVQAELLELACAKLIERSAIKITPASNSDFSSPLDPWASVEDAPPLAKPSLSGADQIAILRQAFRTLKAGYPAPFTYANWSLRDGDLVWSRTAKGGFRTARALAPNNADLPAAFHVLAQERHAMAVRAYRLIEAAHTLRWYASAVFPDRARAVLHTPPRDRHDATLLLMGAVANFTAFAVDWVLSESNEADKRARHAVKVRGFREIAKLNEDRADASRAWRKQALETALQIRRVKRCSTYELATDVANALGRELGNAAPSQNTVYQFLRSAIATAQDQSSAS